MTERQRERKTERDRERENTEEGKRGRSCDTYVQRGLLHAYGRLLVSKAHKYTYVHITISYVF